MKAFCPVLNEDDVHAVLRMDQLIPAMERALVELSAGHVVQPLRTVLPIAEQQGFFGVMPAYAGSLGAKLVTFYPNNTHIPTHHALIVLFKPETGEPLAMMDGRLITEMRTAAVSAVATKALARENVSVLGIIGSGVQARSHLQALRLVRSFEEVRVWSPNSAAGFAKEFQISAASSAQEAVHGADVVVVATTSRIPVLRGEWLSRGTHINAVGACRPDWRELDEVVLERANVFVESREASLAESGDIIASGKVPVEIGEVITGKVKGRSSTDEITLFKSVGVAVEDVVAADLVYRRSLE